MITEFICDRCGQKITLPKGGRPMIYPKLEVPRDVCYACKDDITGLDIKLNQKFAKIIRDIDKEMFPAANNILEFGNNENISQQSDVAKSIYSALIYPKPIYKIGDVATS